jgi:hypothetical protein
VLFIPGTCFLRRKKAFALLTARNIGYFTSGKGAVYFSLICQAMINYYAL